MSNVEYAVDYRIKAAAHILSRYEADHRYALPTIAFFIATIIVFAIGHSFDRLAPTKARSYPAIQRLTACARFLSYRAYRIPGLNWNSAPIGVLALGLIGTIYFQCMTLVPQPYYWPNNADGSWGSSPPIATRSGWLSLACLPFVFATAGKSNLITMATGVSHEKLQVYHRWISYAFLLTALVHTFPFIVHNIQIGTMVSSWNTTVFYWTGTIALIAQAYLTFASISPLRTMSYEWFKFSHFLAALVFVLFLFFHCDHTLSAWDYFIATGILFALSWLHRQTRIYFEHGIGHKARLSMTSNGFVRVSIPTTATWGVGQHFFIRSIGLGIHMGSIHPFTACSLPVEGGASSFQTSELVLYIRPQKGLTARLARLAETKPDGTIRVLLDGPYGGVETQKLVTSQRQLMVAGGSGAGWLIPMITAFLRKHQLHKASGASHAAPSAKIVLATRDVTTQAWFEETVAELLSSFRLEKLPATLTIELHYTGAQQQEAAAVTHDVLEKLDDFEIAKVAEAQHHAAQSDSGSSSSDAFKPRHVKHVGKRPDLRGIVQSETAALDAESSRLGIFVCGPLSMQSDVSNAVADEQVAILKGARREVYLHMEHFSWA